jgi:hypothetical protein
MKTRWAAFAASLVLLAGCPKDPRACNPACGDVPPSDVVDERDAERMDTYDGDVRDGDVRDGDVRDGDVPGGDAGTGTSLTTTFVSGSVFGNSGATSIHGQLVWHGAVRGQSNDGQTKIEAFFR